MSPSPVRRRFPTLPAFAQFALSAAGTLLVLVLLGGGSPGAVGRGNATTAAEAGAPQSAGAAEPARNTGDAESSRATLRAGAAVVDITPSHLPIRIAGSIAEQSADHVHSHLFARAIVLESDRPVPRTAEEEGGADIVANGDAASDPDPLRVAIVVVDSCLIPRDLLDRAKERAARSTGIALEHMLVAATHTHSAPPVTGIHGNDPETAYAAFVETGIVRAIELAVSRLAPAAAAWTSVRCDDHVFCRRWLMREGTAFSIPFTDAVQNRAQMNPGHENPNKIRPLGPVDPEVAILSLRHLDGTPLALLANYSTHYVGAPGISSDYFGAFADRLAERMAGKPADVDAADAAGLEHPQHPPFVGILSNGTSGDANSHDFSRAPVPFDVDSVADRIAGLVADACRTLAHAPDPGPVGILESRLTLGVRLPTPDEVKRARAFLDAEVGDRPIRTWEENYARETVLLAGLPATRELRLQVLRIGGFAATAIPCEVYGSTGLALKAASPFAVTMNIGLANGYEGYLPPPDQFPLGGYTTWRARSSCLEHQAEPKIRATLESLLHQIQADPPADQ